MEGDGGGDDRDCDDVGWLVGWLIACLTPQQHDSVCQGRTCPDKFARCHTEIEDADQNFLFTPNHSILTPDQPVPAPTL